MYVWGFTLVIWLCCTAVPSVQYSVIYSLHSIILNSLVGYVAQRDEKYGSPMIRCLVHTMYNHACHRDMYEIYKTVSIYYDM